MTFDEDLLARVDKTRGDVPRSKWIERAIEAKLDRGSLLDFEGSMPSEYCPPSRSVIQGSLIDETGAYPCEFKIQDDVEPHFKETKKKRS